MGVKVGNKFFEIKNCPAHTPFNGSCLLYQDRCLYRKRCSLKKAVIEKQDLNNFFEVREIEIEEE